MTAPVIIVAILASACLLGGGYLFGVLLSKPARDQLRAELDASAERVKSLEADLVEAQRGSKAHIEARTRAESQLRERLEKSEAQLERVRGQLEERQTLIQKLHRELSHFAETIRSERAKESQMLQQTMQSLLEPMSEQERLANALARLEVDAGARLPGLLEEIAKKGGFGTVILSDDSGLPLAVTREGQNADIVAASAALLTTLADRFIYSGHPEPLAAVLRDEANQNTIHRIFRSGDERFVLTAMTHAAHLPPDALDPALTGLRQVLEGSAFHGVAV